MTTGVVLATTAKGKPTMPKFMLADQLAKELELDLAVHSSKDKLHNF